MDLMLFEKYHDDVKKLMAENERIAIHAVLEEIFLAGIAQAPKLIVELGISKEALSAKVLSMVAALFGAHHIGVDKYAFPEASTYKWFHFIHSDDIEFSKHFINDCGLNWIDPKIDLLFVDTDEIYPHVKQEIESWFPFLNKQCTVMFRCTNLKKTLYYKDGSATDLGWNNERGVIRALAEYLEQGWDETKEWTGTIGEWSIKHWPWGAGLTVMRRE